MHGVCIAKPASHVNAAVSEVGEKESALSQKDQERS